jgi:hypothetical protein
MPPLRRLYLVFSQTSKEPALSQDLDLPRLSTVEVTCLVRKEAPMAEFL